MKEEQKIIIGFRRYLQLMNYVEYSMQTDPRRIKILLNYLSKIGIQSVDQIKSSEIKTFFEALAKTKSTRTNQVYSQATLRNYLTTIKRFAKYLRQSNQGGFEVNVHYKNIQSKTTQVLSRAEIERLYEVTQDSLLGIRDRALLSLFYGCGLRRNEAAHVELLDVVGEKNLLYIRKAKGGKQRYVPLVGRVRKDVMNYINIARPVLLQNRKSKNLMLGIRGYDLGGSSMYERIRKLMQQAEIKDKSGLHILRHSIATHLLMDGMKLSSIAKFLGHSSLESTQIYTHIHEVQLLRSSRKTTENI